MSLTMPKRVVLRWLVAAALVVTGVACSGPGETTGPTTDGTAPTGTAPSVVEVGEDSPTNTGGRATQTGSMTATVVRGTTANGLGLNVVKPTAGTVPFGPGWAIVGFARLLRPIDCVTNATLRIAVRDAVPHVPIVAYPVSPAYAVPTDTFERGIELLDNRPRGDFSFDGKVGTAHVTKLLKTYLGSGRFPSGRTAGLNPTFTVALLEEGGQRLNAMNLVAETTTDGIAPTIDLELRC